MAPVRSQARWLGAVSTCVVVCVALVFVAWAKMETVQITYRIDQLIDDEEKLANEQRRLRARLAQLRSPAHLETLAPELGLAPPKPGQVVVVTENPEALNAMLASEPADNGGKSTGP
ncbi:MAG TPA: hypothetical protein DIU15_06835 [Deltaproteobacteria bacterium]|nr:hypothetical protein [Deltaproteobacteria bacterium]HCP45738.1 hypothetical protein [Deltaproteobacteria bacterium]